MSTVAPANAPHEKLTRIHEKASFSGLYLYCLLSSSIMYCDDF